MQNKKFSYRYLIIFATFLLLFLIPSAKAAYDCAYNVAEGGLVSCCYPEAQEPLEGIACRPEGEFLQKIGSNSPICKTPADLLARAAVADSKWFVGFNCFTNRLNKECQDPATQCYDAGQDKCITFAGPNAACDALLRKTNCDQSCDGCKPGNIQCGAACQSPIDVTCGEGYEPDYCTGTCGCETGYTPSGRVAGICVSFLERFKEIFEDGLTSLGGPDLDGVYDYSYGPLSDVFLKSDESALARVLDWTDGSIPVPIRDLKAGCAVDEVPIWDGSTWSCGGGGLWATDDNIDIYYNVGNVGIGTDAPGQKLEVAGDGKFTGGDVSAWWGNKAITLRQDDNNSYLSNSDDFVANGADPTGFLILTGGGGIKLKYGDSGNTGADGLTLSDSGNVSIGTLDEMAKLYVNGAVGEDAFIVQIDYDTRLMVSSNGGVTIGQYNDLPPVDGLYVRGNVGIGDPNADGVGAGKLYVHNTGDGNSFRVNDVDNDTTPFLIDNAGNVGIGTSSPSSELSISDGGGLSGTPMIYLNERAIFGYDGVRAASLIGGTSGKKIVFDTDGANERMRIAVGGNVGIGTTDPEEKFEVRGGHTILDQYLKMRDWDDDTVGETQLIARDDNWTFWRGGVVIGNDWGNDVIGPIGTDNLVVAGTVGIGNADPTHDLTVEGTDGTIRLLGPDSPYDHGARLLFGDYSSIDGEGYAFIDEFEDDKLMIYARSELYLQAGNSGSGSVTVQDSLKVAHSLYVDSDISVGDDIWVDDDIYLENSLRHYNDDDTRLWFSANDTIRLQTDGNTRLQILSNGFVEILQQTSLYSNLLVYGSAYKTGGGSWLTLSDERLKNIHKDYEYGLKEVNQLKPVRYNYKENDVVDLPTDKEFVGPIAQEVQKVIPEAVSEDNYGYLNIDNDPIIWAMLNAIKELKTRIEVLEAK